MHFLDILRCSDGAFYIGETSDLERRIAMHNEGRASAFTRVRLPVVMVYSETFSDRHAARVREDQLKRWTHAKKEALIVGDWKKLKHLSACDSRHTRRP
jgi:predicted GIY-YIG superfamily endonuclease